MVEAFSNLNRNVFVLQLPSEVDKGALISRYSRNSKNMREIYTTEFENNPERGKNFYDKVFAQFGDESIAEVGSVQLAIENISNICAQFIEDTRIGMSLIEKSSRYLKIDKFYVPPELGDLIDVYNEHCSNSIKVYEKASEETRKYLTEKFPENSLQYDGVKNPQAVYNIVINSKTLDTTRGLLPVSVLTNLGINANGRAYERLILKMKASNIPEVKILGEEIHNELNLAIGPFLQRIDSDHGKSFQNYLINFNSRRTNHFKNHISEIEQFKDIKYDNYVKCIDSDIQLISEVNILANIFYDICDTDISLHSIRTWLLDLSINQRRKLLSQIMSNLRQNRRHNLPRAFENSMWRFEIVSSYAIYRDLHRHRLLTFHRTQFNPHLGYYIPQEIKDIGLELEFKEIMKNSKHVYEQIYKRIPSLAQYALNFAFNYRYQMYLNFRELAHIIELRTIPQGSPEYRIICQKMYKEVKNRSKFLAQFIKFVDLNDYPLERLKSEIKVQMKRDKLEK